LSSASIDDNESLSVRNGSAFDGAACHVSNRQGAEPEQQAMSYSSGGF